MADRNVNVRLSASGGDAFIRVFQEAGQAADRALSGITGSASGLKNILSALGPVGRAAGVAMTAFGAVFGPATKAVAQEEFALARLNAILKATGGSAGVVAADVQGMAAKISASTLASKEDVLEAARALSTFSHGSGTFTWTEFTDPNTAAAYRFMGPYRLRAISPTRFRATMSLATV